MSILFKALHKAARDYRTQKAPIVIPLMKMPAAFDTKRRFRITMVIISSFFIVGLIASIYYNDNAVVKTQKPLIYIKSLAPSYHEYENGIALDADALDDHKVEQIKKHIEQSKAVSKRSKRSSRSSLVITHTGLSITRQLEEAQYALELGAWNKGLKIYSRILRNNPDHQAAIQGKVFALGKRGLDRDLIDLEKLAYKWPKNPLVHANCARILAKQKRMTESLAAWARAYRLAPRNKEYGLGLAVTYDKLGRDRDALRIYNAIPKPLLMGTQRRLDYLNAQFGYYKSR